MFLFGCSMDFLGVYFITTNRRKKKLARRPRPPLSSVLTSSAQMAGRFPGEMPRAFIPASTASHEGYNASGPYRPDAAAATLSGVTTMAAPSGVYGATNKDASIDLGVLAKASPSSRSAPMRGTPSPAPSGSKMARTMPMPRPKGSTSDLAAITSETSSTPLIPDAQLSLPTQFVDYMRKTSISALGSIGTRFLAERALDDEVDDIQAERQGEYAPQRDDDIPLEAIAIAPENAASGPSGSGQGDLRNRTTPTHGLSDGPIPLSNMETEEQRHPADPR